ncbi:hypothetical protein [Cupriavidus basilensis]|uniref:hypothetical protein n=1 Tax=Cupriavidus basilensis TaxID=68895 RepID=UPI0020A6C9BF|nr:hypothetical protein [Cupriavidus basilensis]MCP3024978.1 hypothetical protein [Cupriavidus basilensis]
MRYNHMFTIAFEVISSTPDGEDVTPQQIADAINQRVARALQAGELLEAVGGPDDTYEVD